MCSYVIPARSIVEETPDNNNKIKSKRLFSKSFMKILFTKSIGGYFQMLHP
jgi:hypothetical protein